jgi:hypothetical protein
VRIGVLDNATNNKANFSPGEETSTSCNGEQTDSLTLRRIAVDGLTGRAEGERYPPAHAYAVGVPMAGRHGRVFLSSQLRP